MLGEDRELTLQPRMVVGLISSEADRLEERIHSFSALIENALREVAVSRKASLPDIAWRGESSTDRLESLNLTAEAESGPSFVAAHIVPQEVDAAEVLSDKVARQTLISVSQAGFAREQDILGRNKRNRDNVFDGIAKLKEAKLIETQYLLECSKTGGRLARVSDRSQLESSEIAAFTCPSCGLSFTDENVAEGYLVSDLGLRLARQSQWMTLWVTNLLVSLGIPLDSILWNISEHGEEVDILVQYLDQLWMFELKDREFGAGDAHPMNYRRGLYNASKGIVVTTDRVSQDARRVLNEVTAEARRTGTSITSNRYVLIEGLDTAEEGLRKLMSNAALQYALRKFRVMETISGYSFDSIFRSRFGALSGNRAKQLQTELDA